MIERIRRHHRPQPEMKHAKVTLPVKPKPKRKFMKCSGTDAKNAASSLAAKAAKKPLTAAVSATNGTTVPTSIAVDYPRPNLPRLVFQGNYYTDPSTVNNDLDHYNVETFRPSYQLLQDEMNLNGWWNPTGTSTFAFTDCMVTTTYSPESKQFLHDDVLHNAVIEFNKKTVWGKISDLDPQMQMASGLFGVRVVIKTDDGGFSGLMETTSFCDIWSNLFASEDVGRLQTMSAKWQSTLKIEELNYGTSTFLNECRPYIEASKTVTDDDGNILYPNGALTIRFRTDNYDGAVDSNDYCYGDMNACITPWIPGSPKRFDASRQLYVTDETVKEKVAYANMAYANVQQMQTGEGSADSFSLYIDLINSLVKESPGKYNDQGTIQVGYFPNGYDPDTTLNFISVGEVNYKDSTFEDHSCIVDIPLTSDQKTIIEQSPLGVVAIAADDTKTVLLAEPNDGYFSRADLFVYRLNPGAADSINVDLYVSQFGQRIAGQNVTFGFDRSDMSPTENTGFPANALTINGETPDESDTIGENFSTTIATDENGHISLNIQGNQLDNPRGFIDGQMYGISYEVGDTIPPLRTGPSCEKINVLLFDTYTAPTKPSWLSDILPIFQQYANLYPAMDRIVKLDDFSSVSLRRRGLIRVFGADLDDPMYMPITRDLSKAKSDMIMNFLNSTDATTGELNYMNESLADVKLALQTVIELEHATMPPYLTALYSIKPGYNKYISNTLREVSQQEMLHMAIACNILIAIGGAPNINKMGFVPKYPGLLPGGVRDGLVVRLRKLSVEQVRSFMAIEAPDEQYLIDDGESTMDNPKKSNKYTIGWVYDSIAATLEALDNASPIFPDGLGLPDDDPAIANQVTSAFGDKLYTIRNIDDAKRAIQDIKEEGEGSPGDNDPTEGEIDPDTGLPSLSHFFQFAEIVKGRRIIVDMENKSYSYTGAKVEIDTDGVYNMQDDPKIELTPPNTLQRERMESFANKYQALLNGLQKTFNGEPDYLRECFGLMFQLTIAAQPLMELPALNEDGTEKSDGTRCGISFQVPLS